MTTVVFKLPDLGEGLPDAEVVEWHVAVGDHVRRDDPLVSVETAKAVVEVPSPYAGRLVRAHGNTGDIIEVGSPLAEFETEDETINDLRLRRSWKLILWRLSIALALILY